MKAITRLISSTRLLPQFYTVSPVRVRQSFSTDSENKVDEPFKVEEADTVNPSPPPSEKLLVLGGNGYVGSHVCKEALNRGLTVASLNRSGRSTINEPWADNVIWHKGNLLEQDLWKAALSGVTAVVTPSVLVIASNAAEVVVKGIVFWAALGICRNDNDSVMISCVGGFGSNEHMYKINGTANINAIRAAADEGVKRFVYISAADFGVANYLLKGYYEGKRAAETELLTRYLYGGVVMRPGFIHGTRRAGGMKLPLGVIGYPLEMILQHAKPLSQVPLVGPLLTPPVSVTSVAKVAVRAASDPVFPPGIIDVYGILRYSKQKST